MTSLNFEQQNAALSFEPCARIEGSIDTTPKAIASLRETAARLIPAANKAPLVLGVLGDTREVLPMTLRRLDYLKSRFYRSGTAAIIVLGGIEPSFKGIQTILDRLKGRIPVLALPGDRESRSGFQAAVKGLSPKVVSLVEHRALVLSQGTLVSVPGYYLPHHLLAKEQGCSYNAADIKKLIQFFKDLPRPLVLLSHGPPRGSGPQAVDRAFGDTNIGDPLLSDLIKRAKITIGLFAHVHESAGHAITIDGKSIPPNTWSSSLLLNVGSADSVPHEDLKGHWSKGTAAIVKIHKGKARYTVFTIP